MSVLFGQQVGALGKVYSFEADDWVYQILNKNIEANHHQGVVIPIFGAVHDRSDETLYFPVQDFKRYGAYGSYGIDYKNQTGREVSSLTIDSLAIQDKISFLKIDIQGGDLLAMKGAKSTIMQHRMPIIFEYEYELEKELALCFQDYVDFVHEIDYHFESVLKGRNYLILPNEMS
jgi:FkbM family methyltransferase